MIAFGGMALKNSMVASGGISRHIERQSMQAARQRGCEFILVSPLRCDLPEEARADALAGNLPPIQAYEPPMPATAAE